jgi:hypothetical protein
VALIKAHIHLHRDVLDLPGLMTEPFLMIGFQVIAGADLPEDFNYPNVKQLLEARGLTNVTAIDYFDPAADLRYDMNLPIPEHEHERYQTVYDIGTIEHVFDTRQCLENCMRMVTVDGYYFVTTPVKGYFEHGLHTFAPEVLIRALEMNNFEIVYEQFTSRRGERIKHANEAADSLIWVVGRKTASTGQFKIPQQACYEEAWSDGSVEKKPAYE